MNKPNSQLKKIKWRCRRGMRELDLLLGYFVEKNLNSLDSSQISALEQLLEKDDQQLESWLIKGETPDIPALTNICQQIRNNAALYF